ncbi:MAG: polynucleotide adenylyltransferase PcnB [Acidobacteriota bacterium]|nr:MAG: polynucleotide adenylyltransferase PcnB [Acidobacteriota bacterium]
MIDETEKSTNNGGSPRTLPLPLGRDSDSEPDGKLEIHRPFDESDLDGEAVRVIRRLSANGHAAYLVGGCVRDLLFGLRPKDFDVVTSAHPPEIRKLFRNCRIIGRRFRLAHVYFREKVIEVATFRAESMLGDEGELLIRDDNVFGTAKQDAWRRDLTINALLYDVERQTIVDYVGGVEDAENRVIRVIGDPQVRLREDPIRMLRAIRLAARLDAKVEPSTWDAIVEHRHDVLQAAAPRIGEDLLRMFRGGAMAPAFDLLHASGMLEVVLPELHAHLQRELARGSDEELQAMRHTLRQADLYAHEGRQLSQAVQLGVLLSPVLLARPAGESGSDEAQLLTERFRPIAQRLAISKRESERLRQVLRAVKRLAPRPGRRRRRALGALMRRHYFADALDLFELMADATGQYVEEARLWRRRYEEEYPNGPPEPPRRRKRTRRSRREHGEKGARTG